MDEAVETPRRVDHRAEAKRYLGYADRFADDQQDVANNAAIAQAHATLAVAEAILRLRDEGLSVLTWGVE